MYLLNAFRISLLDVHVAIASNQLEFIRLKLHPSPIAFHVGDDQIWNPQYVSHPCLHHGRPAEASLLWIANPGLFREARTLCRGHICQLSHTLINVYEGRTYCVEPAQISRTIVAKASLSPTCHHAALEYTLHSTPHCPHSIMVASSIWNQDYGRKYRPEFRRFKRTYPATSKVHFPTSCTWCSPCGQG